jgi:hypothetical protein
MGPPSADQLPAGSSRAAGCGSEGKGNAHCEKALERVDGLACWMRLGDKCVSLPAIGPGLPAARPSTRSILWLPKIVSGLTQMPRWAILASG